MRSIGSGAADELEKQSHAHGEAIGDLLEDAGLRPVGDGGINFQAANHWARMQNNGVGLGAAQALGRELVAQNIIVERNGRLVNALGLHAQNHDHVGAGEGFFDLRLAADIGRETFQLARDPHGRTAERDARAKFAEEMNIGARDARMKDVAENCDIEAVEAAFAIADGERVEQGLRGMFVRAVAGIEHGNIHAAGDEIGGARCRVANHDSVGAHGFERPDSVNERFAFFHAGGFGLQIHGIRAETRGGSGEADARARGRLEESESDGFAAEGGEFFEGMALKFLEWLRLIENENNLLGGERFDAEKMAQALRHGIEWIRESVSRRDPRASRVPPCQFRAGELRRFRNLRW